MLDSKFLINGSNFLVFKRQTASEAPVFTADTALGYLVVQSKSELHVNNTLFEPLDHVLGALVTATGHSRVVLELISASKFQYSSSGGIIFASYAEHISI